MESSHESFECHIDPVLRELLDGFGAILIRKGRLIDAGNPEDGRQFALGGPVINEQFGVDAISYTPRYIYDGQEYPESLIVEMNDDGIDKMIFLHRNSETGHIDSNVWLDAPDSGQGDARDLEEAFRTDLSEEEIGNFMGALDLEMQQTIEIEDIMLLQQLLARLRTELD